RVVADVKQTYGFTGLRPSEPGDHHGRRHGGGADRGKKAAAGGIGWLSAHGDVSVRGLMIASESGLAANGHDVVRLSDLGPDGGVEGCGVRREPVDLDVVEVEHEVEDLVRVPVESDREDPLVAAAD